MAGSDMLLPAKTGCQDPLLGAGLRLPEFFWSNSETSLKFSAELRDLSVSKRIGHLLDALCLSQQQKGVVQSLGSKPLTGSAPGFDLEHAFQLAKADTAQACHLHRLVVRLAGYTHHSHLARRQPQNGGLKRNVALRKLVD